MLRQRRGVPNGQSSKVRPIVLLLIGAACLIACTAGYVYYRSSRPTYKATIVHGASPAEGITVTGNSGGLNLTLAHSDHSGFIDDVQIGPGGVRLHGHDLYIDMVTKISDAGIWEGSIPAIHVTVNLRPGEYIVHVTSKGLIGSSLSGNGERSKTFVKTVTVR